MMTMLPRDNCSCGGIVGIANVQCSKCLQYYKKCYSCGMTECGCTASDSFKVRE